MLRIQSGSDFAVAVPLTPKVEDTLYYGRGFRVDYQNMLVLRAFQIADRSVAADIFPRLKRGAFDRFDFAAGISGVQVVEEVFKVKLNDKKRHGLKTGFIPCGDLARNLSSHLTNNTSSS